MSLTEITDIFIAFARNLFILFTLVFFYCATNYDVERKSKSKYVITGIVIGLSAFFVMFTPFNFTEGVFFDTRTILFSISGIFFGPIPTIIGAIIAIAYRIYVGGSGVYIGTFTIIASSLIGILWHYFRRKLKFKKIFWEYYTFGLISQGISSLLFIALPNGWETFTSLIFPFILIFPVATTLICVVMEQQKNRISLNRSVKSQRFLLQALVDSNRNMEIYAVDNNYCYLGYNSFHEKKMSSIHNTKISEGDNIMSLIHNVGDRDKLKQHIDSALLGSCYTVRESFELIPKRYFEISLSPIYIENVINGATIFLQDITERIQHEESIIKLSYYDSLTNVYNRRFYNEQLEELKENNLMFTVITADINGLKLVNDTFGHSAGDRLLITVAKSLSEQFDNVGYTIRVGGDEFIVLLLNKTKEFALKAMEEFSSNLEPKTIHGINISVSFGVAQKKTHQSVEDVLRHSEEQMYKYKLFEVSSHRSKFIETILKTLHEKNPREEKHSQRVSKICVKIGEKLNMTKNDLNLLKTISSLHDIGKIGIDDSILNKPGKLTKDEWKTIKTHPEVGYRILSATPEYSEIAFDILSHHEKYDGTGYPRGLRGEDIPIRARIVSLADAYDAMISERPYRKSFTHQEALEEIKRCSGTQFDPKLVKIFVEFFSQGVK